MHIHIISYVHTYIIHVGTDNTDPPTTIKPDPEAELILHKAKEVHVKTEPEAEVEF